MTNRSEVFDVAVIGAGVTGSLVAGALVAAGRSVLVLDKARGAGGRLSIRRTSQGPFAHGCPPAVMSALVSQAPWLAGSLSSAEESAEGSATPLPKLLLGAARTRFGAQVAGLERVEGRWRLRDAAGEVLAEAARLVLTAPAPQSATLLERVKPDWAETLRGLRMHPSWSLLLALPAGRADPDWSGAQDLLGEVEKQTTPHPAEAATDSHRRWVLRLSEAASATMLEHSPEQVLAAVCDRLGLAVDAFSHAVAHRWRFARVDNPLPDLLLDDPSLQLAVCGDAFAGGAASTDLERCLASAQALLSARDVP